MVIVSGRERDELSRPTTHRSHCMELHFTTLPIDWNKLDPAWRAVLVAVLDAGVTLGGGDAVTLPEHGPTRELLLAVIDRYEAETDTAARWMPEIPMISGDELPGWLLAQQRQVMP